MTETKALKMTAYRFWECNRAIDPDMSNCLIQREVELVREFGFQANPGLSIISHQPEVKV